MVFDPRGVGDHRPLSIHNQNVAQVSSYKYLGVFFDDSLTWHIHVDNLCSKIQQRLHFLRRLRVYGVDQKFMVIFYQAVIESLIRYCITVWFGNLSVQSRSKLIRMIHTAWKIIGVNEWTPLQTMYEHATVRHTERIVCDFSHVLNTEYELLPSGRRFRVPRCRLNRFKNSFIPVSVKLLNRGSMEL